MICQRQWRVAPMGGVIGLDYSAIDVLLRRMGIDTTPDTFAGLQVMESAAVTELNRDSR